MIASLGLPFIPRAGVAAAVPAATPMSQMDVPEWRARHAAKVAEIARVHPDLILLGDSITHDWEFAGPEPWRQFAPVWRRFYGDRNAVNLGFGGDTTANLLWRIQNGEVDGIDPKVAIILIGANNLGRPAWTPEDTVNGIDTILTELKTRLPRTKLLLLGILPSDRSISVTEATTAINRHLADKFAGDPMVSFMDAGYVFMKDGQLDRTLFFDMNLRPPGPPLHPNPEGQARLAAAIEPTLARLLGDTPHR